MNPLQSIFLLSFLAIISTCLAGAERREVNGTFTGQVFQSEPISVGVLYIGTYVNLTAPVIKTPNGTVTNGTYEICGRRGAVLGAAADYEARCEFYVKINMNSTSNNTSDNNTFSFMPRSLPSALPTPTIKKETVPLSSNSKSSRRNRLASLVYQRSTKQEAYGHIAQQEIPVFTHVMTDQASNDTTNLPNRAGDWIFYVRAIGNAAAGDTSVVTLEANWNACTNLSSEVVCPDVESFTNFSRSVNDSIGPQTTVYGSITPLVGAAEISMTITQFNVSVCANTTVGANCSAPNDTSLQNQFNLSVYQGGYPTEDNADMVVSADAAGNAKITIASPAANIPYIFALTSDRNFTELSFNAQPGEIDCNAGTTSTACPSLLPLDLAANVAQEITLEVGKPQYLVVTNQTKFLFAVASELGGSGQPEVLVRFNAYPTLATADYVNCTAEKDCSAANIIEGSSDTAGNWFISVTAQNEDQTKVAVWTSGCPCGSDGTCDAAEGGIGSCTCSNGASSFNCELADDDSSSGLSTTAIVLIVLGAVLVFGAIVALIGFFAMRAKKRKQYQSV